ncbi:Peptidyl-prolyl cis-trans isomerase FKBP12 [Linum grandiflorum]
MGVEKEIIRPGNGPKPSRGQKVTVHCTGFGKNGDLSEKFWSVSAPRTLGSSLSLSILAKEASLKGGMKVSWECKWEKWLVYGAPQTTLMEPMDLEHGESCPIQLWFLKLKSWA